MVDEIVEPGSSTLVDAQFTSFHASIRQLATFEVMSWLGRHFLNRKPPLHQDRPNRLNLGCAVTIFPDWVNADFFDFHALAGKGNDRLDWMLDLRYPLNCPSNVWDGVFCEHTIEHLYPLQVLNLLRELYRTMKPGAWLRLSVPDLEKYVSYYSGRLLHESFAQWNTGCEAICYLTQNYHHISTWDANLLGRYLEQAGFGKVSSIGFRQGTDTSLLMDREARSWETLYMEARKP